MMELVSHPSCGPLPFCFLLASALVLVSCTGGLPSAQTASAVPPSDLSATEPTTTATLGVDGSVADETIVQDDTINLSELDTEPWLVNWPTSWNRGHLGPAGAIILLPGATAGSSDTVQVTVRGVTGVSDSDRMEQMRAVAKGIGDSVSIGVPSVAEHSSGSSWLTLRFNLELDGLVQSAVVHSLVFDERMISFVLVSDPATFPEHSSVLTRLIHNAQLDGA